LRPPSRQRGQTYASCRNRVNPCFRTKQPRESEDRERSSGKAERGTARESPSGTCSTRAPFS
jgi:hypothetical protein